MARPTHNARAKSLAILQRLAIQSLHNYRLCKPKLFLLGNAHNTTYRVETEDGSRYVLKLHNPVTTSQAYVASEMIWLEALHRETQLLVPEPIRDRAGQFVGSVGEGEHRKLYRLMSWVPGQRRSRGMRQRHFEALGELLASLQNHAIVFSTPQGFTRPQYGRRRLRSRLAALRSAADERLITPSQSRFFDRAAEYGDAAMAKLGRGRAVFGLIHGDLGYGNSPSVRRRRAWLSPATAVGR
jgi:Ser/Thr protein kinase RdoA (MazF antagonist)